MTTESQGESQSPFFRAAWGVYLVMALGGLLWLGSHHGDIRLDLFINFENLVLDVLIGIAAGLSLVAIWQLGRRRIAAMREMEEWMARAIGPLSASEIFVLALISGFSEELLFRGAMQSAWGWAWSLGIFTILHTGPKPAFRFWTLFALVAGGLFAYLTLWRGALLSAMIAHIVVNAINMRLLLENSRVFDLDLPET